MNKSINHHQAFGFFSNLSNSRDKWSYSIESGKILKKILQQTTICLIAFFIIISMNSLNTETSNKIIEEIVYRLNQEFDYQESYYIVIGWGKDLLLKGESALEVINIGGYSQRSFIKPVEGNIVKLFNEGDATSGKPINGIVIEAVEGTVVLAADEGVVIEANASQGLGHYIIIKHRGEYLSVYKQLQESKVEVNTKVNKGEVIGTSSDKLLFEVWQRKTPIDPMQFIKLEEISL